MYKFFRNILCLAFLSLSIGVYASSVEDIEQQKNTVETEDKAIDPQSFIMGHLADSHNFHILDWKGKAIGVPLPIILWTDSGLKVFMSSAFHHDNSAKHIVNKGSENFVCYNDIIYYASPQANKNGQYLSLDENGELLNKKPLDFSITKIVVTMFVGLLLVIIIIISATSFYRKKENIHKAPKGGTNLLEILVDFVVYEVIKPNVGDKHYKKYAPYLLTVFFVVLSLNLLGLVPIFPFGANVTGNIAFTVTLALLTFTVTQLAGTKEYWKEVFAMPGLPKWILIIMTPVEFVSLFTKPFALAIRLFAAMLSGHIIILSLVLMIFLFKNWAIVPMSGFFVVFLNLIEVLICLIQAYIFTLLSSLYIGMAKAEPHQKHH